MKRLASLFLLCIIAIAAAMADGNTYYVSPTGSDMNTGTESSPLATVKKALEKIGTTSDCTIYLKPGEYNITTDQFMDYGTLNSVYAVVYPIKADGTKIIGIKDSQGNRPVLNFTNATFTLALDSNGKPSRYYRISAFWLYANNITLKDFEITHVQSLYTGKTQSECISARRGSNCLIENIAMHDGMAIGYYQTHGSNNIIRNCDAYNIWDEVGYGGNGEDSDGFGFHLGNTAYTGTRVINCRAWWCGDDGFDCINNKAAISFEGCWAFYNGYKPGGNTSCGNGNGFKIGGYGKPASNYPDVIPSHTIKGCVAFYNKSNGFYANHHLGGNTWENNTAMYNNKNFDMCNYSLTAADDVKGYGHVLRNNVSYNPRTTDAHWTTIDAAQCTQENNRIIADATEAAANFINSTRLSVSNMSKIDLCKSRKADGSLPEIDFLVAKRGSEIFQNKQGALFAEYAYVPETTPEEGGDKPVLHVCGDSMTSIYGNESNDASATQDYNNGMRGWGQFLQDYISTESGVIVQDWAHTGTTAKGFYGGANYWPVVMGTNSMTDAFKLERPYVKDYVSVKKGDYVIIVFGHNDQKGGTLHNGYKTVTESEYTIYLTKMVEEVKAKGAFPILGTSICRCLFSNGTLKYLGKIDACEAAGAVHSEDCEFDYPAAVRKLAAELQVPCLDLNAGSQALWEGFGQSLTASLFFPNGGTTHTSETGARAMGIYANNTIKAWNDEDLNGAGFANYSALINAMKADVIQYKKADYLSQETKVSEEKIWRFDNQGYADKDTIATSVVELDGLFLRATDTKSSKNTYNRCISVRSGKTSVDFLSDQTTMYTRVPAGNFTGISATSTAGMSKSNTTTPTFALNTTGPGTLYVSMATENTSTSDRYLKIMFNGEDKVSVATTTLTAYSPTTLSYHATEGGSFFFGGTVAYRVFAVKYVPDADDSEEELHEVSVNIPASGIGTLTNCKKSHALTVPEGLTAWVATGATASKVMFSAVEGIPVATGVVVRGTPGETYSLTPVETEFDIPSVNYMQAVTTDSDVPSVIMKDGEEYTSFILSDGTFYKSSGEGKIEAGKSFLQLPSSMFQAAARSLSLYFGGEQTAVSQLEDDSLTMENGNYYNLAAQRVSKAFNGIIIHNGKKYVR